ncbi:hypothetical protein PANT_4c00011 [Moesziomyces antarcticus T-34]|uniref:Uncharacterized protein n=1 Tax=Pseudozyma antarctica (strain T-34) TaxID=1151754 RepID=M9MAF6_PSEA3|nr:hypothetical protein PANT_4c00011 [Moesziomyces antarcticus T-34]
MCSASAAPQRTDPEDSCKVRWVWEKAACPELVRDKRWAEGSKIEHEPHKSQPPRSHRFPPPTKPKRFGSSSAHARPSETPERVTATQSCPLSCSKLSELDFRLLSNAPRIQPTSQSQSQSQSQPQSHSSPRLLFSLIVVSPTLQPTTTITRFTPSIDDRSSTLDVRPSSTPAIAPWHRHRIYTPFPRCLPNMSSSAAVASAHDPALDLLPSELQDTIMEQKFAQIREQRREAHHVLREAKQRTRNQQTDQQILMLMQTDERLASLLSQAADSMRALLPVKPPSPDTVRLAPSDATSASASSSSASEPTKGAKAFEVKAQQWFSILNEVQYSLRSAPAGSSSGLFDLDWHEPSAAAAATSPTSPTGSSGARAKNDIMSLFSAPPPAAARAPAANTTNASAFDMAPPAAAAASNPWSAPSAPAPSNNPLFDTSDVWSSTTAPTAPQSQPPKSDAFADIWGDFK